MNILLKRSKNKINNIVINKNYEYKEDENYS